MIVLSHRHLQEIRDHGERTYPNECCGLLVGTRDLEGTLSVTRVEVSDNVRIQRDAEGGQDRFEVDPQLRFDLMRALRDSDEAIIGHYHSHPDHPPEPSIHDLDMAFEPELVWLIVSVRQGQSGDTKAWRLNRDSGEIKDVTLIIDER